MNWKGYAMRRMHVALVGASLAALALAMNFAEAQAPASKAVLGNWGFELSGMDRNTRPGDDFFRYANGAWYDTAVIPADRTQTGSFVDLDVESEKRVQGILADLEKRTDLSPEEKKVADL